MTTIAAPESNAWEAGYQDPEGENTYRGFEAVVFKAGQTERVADGESLQEAKDADGDEPTRDELTRTQEALLRDWDGYP